jgi:hypothetical protein
MLNCWLVILYACACKIKHLSNKHNCRSQHRKDLYGDFDNKNDFKSSDIENMRDEVSKTILANIICTLLGNIHIGNAL